MKTAADVAKILGLKLDDALLFQGVATSILAAVSRGELDLNLLAREELANRGLDKHGEWVGFEAAARIHQAHP